MILAIEGKIPPPEAPERLRRLGEMRIIPEALSNNLVEMAKFRNVLAHIYHALDLLRLYQFSRVDIKDIEDFIGYVNRNRVFGKRSVSDSQNIYNMPVYINSNQWKKFRSNREFL
jgi:uncharacterized protein YutE (UPF0331/DUF86 family)